MKNLRILCLSSLLIAVVLSGCNPKPKNYLQESKADKDKRMEWWRDAGFGMFIHWGIYSVPAGIYKDQAKYAEWIMNQAHIPKDEYEKFASAFNPVKFNAEEWVRMAKDAGMKYIVITSKHHDGFCMWNSKVSDYDIMDRTPFGRDVLKELSKACKKEGIRLCFYHSIMDWHQPWENAEDFPKYREEYLKPQLKELLTHYGDIGVLWFDGEWIKEWTEEQGRDLYNYVRNLQPDIIINNRVGKGRAGMQGMNKDEKAVGDFGTPEQEILEGTSGMDWESCMTMNDHWGYASYDKDFKSAETLIHNLIDIAAKGGNYLLNIGPTSEGVFPPESIERLKEIGNWMKINGEIIHNSASVRNYKEGRNLYYLSSKDHATLYAVITSWPGDSLLMKYAKPREESAITLLGYDKPLSWKSIPEKGIVIKLPNELQLSQNRPCNYAWVFKFEGNMGDVASKPVIVAGGKMDLDEILFTDTIQTTLASSTPGAVIRYSLDGSMPEHSSPVYSEPLTLNKSTLLKAYTEKEGMINSQLSQIEFHKISSFKNLTLTYSPSPKYSARGPLTLGNGTAGSVNFNDGEWLGWEGSDFEAILQPNTSKPYSKVSIGFLQNQGSWIFLPKTVRLDVSNDGKNFVKVAEKNLGEPVKENENFIRRVSFSFYPKEYKYIRIFAKNQGTCPSWHSGAGEKCWLFVDEIMVE